MKCLERYRGGLIRGLNRNLKVILQAPDETAIHDFRVGIKRVTALYEFLQAVDPEFDAAGALARYRGLFKAGGRVRDLQVTHAAASLEQPAVAREHRGGIEVRVDRLEKLVERGDALDADAKIVNRGLVRRLQNHLQVPVEPANQRAAVFIEAIHGPPG